MIKHTMQNGIKQFPSFGHAASVCLDLVLTHARALPTDAIFPKSCKECQAFKKKKGGGVLLSAYLHAFSISILMDLRAKQKAY